MPNIRKNVYMYCAANKSKLLFWLASCPIWNRPRRASALKGHELQNVI